MVDMNFISINPDTRNLSGHFLGYDLNLREACNYFGIPFYSLCWKETPKDFLQQNHQFRPTFKEHSWMIGNQGIYGPKESVLKQFRKEIEYALQEILETIGNTTNILYMYTGSLNHTEILSQLALKYENVVLHVNLFWLPFKNLSSPEFKKRWTTFLKFIYNSSKIHATVPTEELQEDIERMFDIKLEVAPHPSVLVSDQDFMNLKIKQFNQVKLPNFSQGNTILFPGNLGGTKNKTSKGYLVSIEIIKIIAEINSKKEESHYQIFMKKTFDNEDVNQELEKIKSIVNFFEDGLPSRDFFKILSFSDIVVLPYAKEAFSKRTSGLFIDSLYLGKPVVSSKNTWMGNRIEELDCGIVVDQNDPNSFVEAINQISKHYPYYKKNAIIAGIKWFQCNNWTSLLASLLHQ
ncbi:glycosyltransferase [Geitlerinema sp. PCC 9228]|uniref:glycosyltransferase n=1 Tax=Geitlerinema sp. PCC 9228 TaxID=111611 RepID=UPI0008F9BFC1|nr:glycosyltransferase [Geitlerinema sp. PCC 9228]